MQRPTCLATVVALTICSSAGAAGPAPVSLASLDLDWVTAGSAEVLRGMIDDGGEDDVGTLTDRASRGDGGSAALGLPVQERGWSPIVQVDRQGAPVAAASATPFAAGVGINPVATPQFGVPGAVVLPILTTGIGGIDGLAGPLGNDAAIGVVLSLGALGMDRPPIIGTPGGESPFFAPGPNGGGL